MAHPLTWEEARILYLPQFPVEELAEREPELMIDYDFTCSVIEDRIAFLARHSCRPFPDEMVLRRR